MGIVKLNNDAEQNILCFGKMCSYYVTGATNGSGRLNVNVYLQIDVPQWMQVVCLNRSTDVKQQAIVLIQLKLEIRIEFCTMQSTKFNVNLICRYSFIKLCVLNKNYVLEGKCGVRDVFSEIGSYLKYVCKLDAFFI